LLWPDLSYPTAVVARAGPPAACPKTPRLLVMGSSFLHEIAVVATLAPCPPAMDYWFYMRTEDNGVELGHYHRPPGETGNGARESADLAALEDNVRDADAVILEENEATLGETKQVGHLLAVARARRPVQPAGGAQ
jgi:hypothetical protein